MDDKTREELQSLLDQYVCETLDCIHTMQEFCAGHPKWLQRRESELEKMRDVLDRSQQIEPSFKHVQSSKDKAKAVRQYMWRTLTQVTADSRRGVLEKELGGLLQEVLAGLGKLQGFLEAVERLAVSSLFVFSGESFLPRGVSAASVRALITAARLACPLLVHFKRDDAAFFLPHLHNVPILAFQLDKYIRVSQQLCDRIEKRSSSFRGEITKPKVQLNLDMSNEATRKMLHHVKQLINIRKDRDFHLVLLFQEVALHFIGMLSQRRSRMDQFLLGLEQSATQLDKMRMGAAISSVAGSSVAAAGGVLSIVGLALAPVTAGVSLTLTVTGLSLGVTSGINSLVTGVTEMAVNGYHGKTANSIFQSYKEDVEKLQECVEQVASSEGPVLGLGVGAAVVEAGRLLSGTGGVARRIDALVDGVSAFKVLKSKEVASRSAQLGMQEVKAGQSIPRLASDLPDVGQLAKGPLAITPSARAGLIGLNAFFIGMDVLFICKDSMSLARGARSQEAQLIRARAALWRSEQESWDKIHDSLCRGIWTFRKNRMILEQPFHP